MKPHRRYSEEEKKVLLATVARAPEPGNLYCTLTEAKVLIEEWRREYNGVRPHSSLGYRPPAPEAVIVTETT
jgi:transposase InsO family protein